VLDETLIAHVNETAGEALTDMQVCVHVSQQNQAAVTAERSTTEVTLHAPSCQIIKLKLFLLVAIHVISLYFGCVYSVQHIAYALFKVKQYLHNIDGGIQGAIPLSCRKSNDRQTNRTT